MIPIMREPTGLIIVPLRTEPLPPAAAAPEAVPRTLDPPAPSPSSGNPETRDPGRQLSA